MKKGQNKICKSSHAFTLIEVIIVLAVISLLIALAVPRYRTFTIRAARAEAFQNINSLRALVKSYHEENGVPVDASQIGPNPDTIYWYGVSLDDTSTLTSCNNSNVYGFSLKNCQTARYAYWVGVGSGQWQILIQDNGSFCPGYPKYFNDEVQYCPQFDQIRVIRDLATRGCGGPLLFPRSPCAG